MSTVVSVFPGLGASPWLPTSGGVPLAPLYFESVVPSWIVLICAALVAGGIAFMIGYAAIQIRPWKRFRALQAALRRAPRRRHRHA